MFGMREASLASDGPQRSPGHRGWHSWWQKGRCFQPVPGSGGGCCGHRGVRAAHRALQVEECPSNTTLSTDGLLSFGKKPPPWGVPGTAVSSQEVCQQGGPGTVLVHLKSVGRIGLLYWKGKVLAGQEAGWSRHLVGEGKVKT